MLKEKGFNLWAKDYEESVYISYESNEYPFAGYTEILNRIFNNIMEKPNSNILDIGIGTGILSKKLYDNNHQITGIDFSQKMLDIALGKMKNAKFIKYDFSDGLPNQLNNCRYDFIIFTYSIHHLPDIKKTKLINSLKSYLNLKGKIIIGDVSFHKKSDLINCQNKFSSVWDYDEYYYCYDDIKNKLDFANKSYFQMSFCSGIMTLSR